MNENLKQLMLEAHYAAPEIAERAQILANKIIQRCLDIAAAQILQPKEYEDDEHFAYAMGYKFAVIDVIEVIQAYFGVTHNE